MVQCYHMVHMSFWNILIQLDLQMCNEYLIASHEELLLIFEYHIHSGHTLIHKVQPFASHIHGSLLGMVLFFLYGVPRRCFVSFLVAVLDRYFLTWALFTPLCVYVCGFSPVLVRSYVCHGLMCLFGLGPFSKHKEYATIRDENQLPYHF